MKIKTVKTKFLEIVKQLETEKNDISLNYCIEVNAGDSFNSDFINDYFNKTVSKYTFGRKEHYLFCGSILSRCNRYSTIIGAGLISENIKFSEFKEVIGCRGKLTLGRIVNESKTHSANVKFLGDPGLLVREIFDDSLYEKKGVIGIIPHFVDYDVVSAIVNGDKRFKIIDIRRNYKEVCNDILRCNSILSSSLHGLIFSDGLNVPNNWVRFGDDIVGGNFKFMDYYSVMSSPKSVPDRCSSIDDLLQANKKSKVSTNKNYNGMLDTINEYFR